LEEALQWHGKAVQIDLKVCGTNHPHFLVGRANAEITHEHSGRGEPFESWMKATLAGE